ncbi:hypothetical protein [Azomonas macrocytogenes]|uniref:Uncharacterized protein n=1 Tax=Azomonas macrocytogenes TaxID=69962 RepID=A0A839T1K5_AZOMA|nr:hypothetical protein [Azomonas macrocytogenes]MBB3103282.1 hypothetical protein [Azomonas macrocytogenes]
MSSSHVKYIHDSLQKPTLSVPYMEKQDLLKLARQLRNAEPRLLPPPLRNGHESAA